MSANAFYPWLFDDKGTWQQVIQDPRWNYDLPMSKFMQLYNEHHRSSVTVRTPTTTVISASTVPFAKQTNRPVESTAAPTASPSGGAGQILSQNEIDSLLNAMAH